MSHATTHILHKSTQMTSVQAIPQTVKSLSSSVQAANDLIITSNPKWSFDCGDTLIGSFSG